MLEYDAAIDGLPYHVYGGLMTRCNVVYNRTFIGYAYRFVEETTDLFKGISTAHLQVFLGEEWRECLGTHKNATRRRGIQISWDAALRQMGELRVADDGEITVILNPEDLRIRGLRDRCDCPGLVHIISAYVAQYAALSEGNAKRALRPGILRAADPGLRDHEVYAYYYDRVDQPAVAHEAE